MVQRVVRKDVKKCQKIYHHPDYWIFIGNKFQSCSKQGGPLVTYPKVKTSVYRMAALSNNRLLVDDSRGVLHLLDLEAGNVIAAQNLTNKRTCRSRFAISDDGAVAFCIWNWGKNWFLCKINVPDLSYHIYNYKPTMCCVQDISFNSRNELLVLETQNASIGDKVISQNQISAAVVRGNECEAVPIYRWDGPCAGMCFDGKYLLRSDYSVLDIDTREPFDLLENSDIFLPPNYVALSRIYYPEYNYLQLVNAKHNMFIDCEKRRIIARYINDPRNNIYSGIYTGDEFWIGKPDGIYAMPFPVIEEH